MVKPYGSVRKVAAMRPRTTRGLPQFWGTTLIEESSGHPAAVFATRPYEVWIRAIDVDADPATVFRWLCQVRVAPYSYDLLDNLGRRSPRRLTTGADRLSVGQWVMIGRIVAFEPGRSFTVLSSRHSDLVFGGPIVLTYAVESPVSETARARIVVHLAVTARSRAARLRRVLLAWGDLVMMRKQLLTLAALAEREDARDGYAADEAAESAVR
jgi:hypothetical protein